MRTRVVAMLLIVVVIQSLFPAIPAFSSNELTADAAQAADIMGIRQEAEQLVRLRKLGANSETERHQLNNYRALVLRKTLQAVLQTQSAQNRLEMEIAYAYDVMSREQRKVDTVNQFFNIFNFAQLGVLYGIIEPYSRIHSQFTQSAIGTCVGSGLALGLPIMNIAYGKFFAKASHLAPPGFLSQIIDGKPVDGSNLPPLVALYLDLPAAGSTITRREALNAVWKERYRADITKKETLCGIDDGKSKKSFVLNARIVLLWSLYTTIQGFNKELLSLVQQVSDYQPAPEQSTNTRIGMSSGLGAGADEAARLLRLEAVVAELKALNGSDAGERSTELKIKLLETVLAGFIDVQIAVDRCQEELNYQYDVVLAQMMARRGKFLQKTYEANFIQTGTLGACAGWSYLNHYPKAGNQLFIVSNSIGLCITTVSLLAGHGGWRKNQSEPNSLADFFDLRDTGTHGFSPLVWNFLNSSSPKRSDGKSRRQYLQEVWTSNSIANVKLKDRRNLEKLGSMPSCKWDTIKLVLNRIALLNSLREQLGQFDAELLDLLRQAWPQSVATSAPGVHARLSPSANGAAELLGIQGLMADATNDVSQQDAKLSVTRIVMEGFLSAMADSNVLGHQVVVESQVVNQMIRQRDMAIQLTNVSNFYQLGILGIISDSLGLSSISKYVLYGDRVNLVSGGLILGFATGALLERHGGIRPRAAEPNSISAAFGKSSKSANLSPLMVKYLNAVSPLSQTSLSRREELIKYWKESKVLNVNIQRESTVEKLSAEGKAHHWFSETIKLINNRITMLYDLRAVLRTSSTGFEELLKALN